MTFHSSFVPAGMPAPHSPAPVPGLAQVSVPFGTTLQPLAFSSGRGTAGLNGYGLVTRSPACRGSSGSTGPGRRPGRPRR